MTDELVIKKFNHAIDLTTFVVYMGACVGDLQDFVDHNPPEGDPKDAEQLKLELLQLTHKMAEKGFKIVDILDLLCLSLDEVPHTKYIKNNGLLMMMYSGIVESYIAAKPKLSDKILQEFSERLKLLQST